jgi:hypothetical protein
MNIGLAAQSETMRYRYPLSPYKTGFQEKKLMRPGMMQEFFQYAREGNIPRLKEILEEYDNFDEPLDFFTAVYHATAAGNLESVKFFAVYGAHMTRFYPSQDSIKARQWEYGRPVEIFAEESLLDIAIQHGHRDVAVYLAQFIPLSFHNGRGELPICNALRLKQPEIAFALIKNNSSYRNYLAAEEITREAETALSCARTLGYRDIADVIAVALVQPLPDKIQPSQPLPPSQTPKKSIVPSRWILLPGLCALAVAALYLYKEPTNGPKRFLESLVRLSLMVSRPTSKLSLYQA